MLRDHDTLMSDGQAIVADAASTNYINLGLLARDIGPGRPIYLDVRCVEDFDNLTSLNVSIEKDDNSAFSSPVKVNTVNVLLADLIAGKEIPGFQIIPDGTDEQYMRMYYDVDGTNPTVGKIDAGVVTERQTNKENL